MRRHDTDVTSLVFGLIFIGVAGVWALVQGDLLSLPDLSIVGPAVLVFAGVIGLIATLAGSARSRSAAPVGQTTEPVETTEPLETTEPVETTEARPSQRG